MTPTIRDAYNQFLDKYIQGPLLDKDGNPCKGTTKRAYETSNPDHLALLASPRRESRPKAYAAALEQEIKIHQYLKNCPHLPRLHKVAAVPGESYALIVDYLGLTLFDLFNEVKDWENLETIAKKGLETLAFMHRKGILHGDVKLENCSWDGNLFDLGHAEEIGDQRTRNLKFSRPYRPPEMVIFNEAFLSSDIWALGSMLFELFTREPLIPIHKTKIDRLHAYKERLNYMIPPKEAPECFDEEGNLKPKSYSNKLPDLEAAIHNKFFFFGSRVDSYREMEEKREQLLDLLKKMCHPNPLERISAKEALSHPFFTASLQTDLCVRFQKTGKQAVLLQIFRDNVSIGEISFSKREEVVCYHLLKKNPYEIRLSDPKDPDTFLWKSGPLNLKERQIFHLNVESVLSKTDAPKSRSPALPS